MGSFIVMSDTLVYVPHLLDEKWVTISNVEVYIVTDSEGGEGVILVESGHVIKTQQYSKLTLCSHET